MDRYTVVVVKERNVVACVPQQMSLVCLLFTRRGETMQGKQCYLSDLAQGKPEILCCLIVSGQSKE